VLLGPTLVAVWGKWEAAGATTADEANELAGIFWFAHSLPQPRPSAYENDLERFG
jgi:hypothetical protein